MAGEITYVGEDRRTVTAVQLAFRARPGEWLSVDDIVGDRDDIHRFDVRLALVEMLATGELFERGSVEVMAGDDGKARWRAKT